MLKEQGKKLITKEERKQKMWRRDKARLGSRLGHGSLRRSVEMTCYLLEEKKNLKYHAYQNFHIHSKNSLHTIKDTQYQKKNKRKKK